MAHITNNVTSNNTSTVLEVVDTDWQKDADAVWRLPVDVRNFVLYEADAPYDVFQIHQMLRDLPAHEVLRMLRIAQYNDRSTFYPGLDKAPAGMVLW